MYIELKAKWRVVCTTLTLPFASDQSFVVSLPPLVASSASLTAPRTSELKRLEQSSMQRLTALGS